MTQIKIDVQINADEWCMITGISEGRTSGVQ